MANSTNNPLKTCYSDNLLKIKLKENKIIKQKQDKFMQFKLM